jgi:hypothetical protein
MFEIMDKKPRRGLLYLAPGIYSRGKRWPVIPAGRDTQFEGGSFSGGMGKDVVEEG